MLNIVDIRSASTPVMSFDRYDNHSIWSMFDD